MIYNSDEATTSSEFRFHTFGIVPLPITSPSLQCSMMPGENLMSLLAILYIFLTLKISAREVSENHLYAYSVIAVQDDFFVLSDCFHD